MGTAILAALGPLVAKLPATQTLKWISGGVLLLTVAVVSGYAGYRWELSAFDDYKATAATHELALGEAWRVIGDATGAKYLAKLRLIHSDTERQLEALRNVPPIPAPPALPTKGGHARKPVAPVAADPDARVIGVLRGAFTGSKE